VPISESTLYNASSDILGDPSDSGYAAALSSIKSSKGWYYDFTQPGEKGLAKTTIYAGILYATTYVPPSTSGTPTACGEPTEGTAYLHAVNLLDASGTLTSNSRTDDVGGGIPSELVVVIREDGVSGLIGTSGGASQPPVERELPRKPTYWYQE
jgi:type IV pilus assembly protein PilY1